MKTSMQRKDHPRSGDPKFGPERVLQVRVWGGHQPHWKRWEEPSGFFKIDVSCGIYRKMKGGEGDCEEMIGFDIEEGYDGSSKRVMVSLRGQQARALYEMLREQFESK